MIRSELVNKWVVEHNKDLEGAKFKIGQRVIVPNQYGTVVGVGATGHADDGFKFEYAVDGCNSLVWECEVEVTNES